MPTTRSSAQKLGAQLNLDDSFASAESETEIEIEMTFDTENGVDEAGAHSKLSSVKVAYDPKGNTMIKPDNFCSDNRAWEFWLCI